MSNDSTHEPLQGKTYSLRLNGPDSDSYYCQISELANRLLGQFEGPPQMLRFVHDLSRRRRRLRKLVSGNSGSSDGVFVSTLHHELAPYTNAVESHLEGLRLRDWFGTLATTRPQYHLSMLEIELTNRIFAAEFRSAKRRLAFLPHCLRDLTAHCLAAPRGLDYVCKGCTTDCTINRLSKMLRRHRISPYLWMEANLHSLFRKTGGNDGQLGVLGIACIPELVRGMRLCRKYGIPVVGIPLDANRCSRWWGELRWNGINFTALEKLL